MKGIDRELSWVDFNYRVLYQAMRDDIPFLERFNFLGISYSNMNEFISVRFSSVLESFLKDSKTPDDLGKTNYRKKYTETLKAIMKFKKAQDDTYDLLVRKAEKLIGVTLIDNAKKLTEKDAKFTKRYFESRILPFLIPVTIDSTKEFPLLQDSDVHFMVKVSDHHQQNLCLVALPKNVDRIVHLGGKRYIFVDEIIRKNFDKLFIGKHIEEVIEFKTYQFVADSLDMNDDEFLIDRMKKYLSDRDFSNNKVFIDVRSFTKHSDLIKILYKMMDVYKGHVYETNHPVQLKALCDGFYHDKKYEYQEFKSKICTELMGDDGVLKHLNKEDVLMQHPYESYDSIIDFLEEASVDPDVVAIKQTLYRVSSEDSPIIDALCKASKNGKKVIILLEIKARFDERQNIELTRKLEDSGCIVVCGLERLKVHCKMALVIKNTNKGVRIYSHIGTGNYNEKTAKGYTDISYMTSSIQTGTDLNNLFNSLTGFSDPEKTISGLFYSPHGIRNRILKMIDRVVKSAKKGEKAEVVLKMNSLCDYKTIKAIYKAADEGVKFTIICRGICSILAGKNIMVKSIIGRYLEHSRIYMFTYGSKEDIYISSADLLTRNLDKRVELMVPIKDKNCKRKLMNILKLFTMDQFNSFNMNNEGIFIKTSGKDINVHEIFVKRAKVGYKIPKKKG